MQAWRLDHSRIFCISLCLPVWFCILFFTENQLFRAWYHPSKWEWLWRHRVGLFSAHSSKTRLQHSSSGMAEKKCTFSVGIGCRIFLIILMTVGMGMNHEPLRVLRDIKQCSIIQFTVIQFFDLCYNNEWGFDCLRFNRYPMLLNCLVNCLLLWLVFNRN